MRGLAQKMSQGHSLDEGKGGRFFAFCHVERNGSKMLSFVHDPILMGCGVILDVGGSLDAMPSNH
jgi:hypothetical protein